MSAHSTHPRLGKENPARNPLGAFGEVASRTSEKLRPSLHFDAADIKRSLGGLRELDPEEERELAMRVHALPEEDAKRLIEGISDVESASEEIKDAANGDERLLELLGRYFASELN